AEKGEKINTFRALFDLWIATAEKTYFEIASTESFAEIQGKLVNAAMQHRVRERELMDAVVKSMHLPTRRELDDAYRHLHDLKNEVRALRREVAQLESSPSTPQAMPPAPQEPRAAPVKGSPRKKAASSAKAASRAGKED
ncbi:MAG: hypothetical protein IH608_02385, partial [Proteobacteria bacterium]|nr:hypothetical protein [Pseudomonadota bacterium]